MTPFFNGWITRISGGVRPIIALASLPTARIERSCSRSATIEGSLTTMPSPWTNTSVFDVPRSIATSLENLRKNIRPLCPSRPCSRKDDPRRLRQQGSGGSRQPEGISTVCARSESGSARGGAHGVEELSSRERLVEKRGTGGPERLVRLFADGAGRDEDEPVADGGSAGRDLSQELEPVDAVQIEVRDDQIDPVAQVLAGFVGAGDGESCAARRLEMFEQDLLHRLIVLDDEDALALEVNRRAGPVVRRPAGAADRQIDRERRAVPRAAVGHD